MCVLSCVLDKLRRGVSVHECFCVYVCSSVCDCIGVHGEELWDVCAACVCMHVCEYDVTVAFVCICACLNVCAVCVVCVVCVDYVNVYRCVLQVYCVHVYTGMLCACMLHVCCVQHICLGMCCGYVACMHCVCIGVLCVCVVFMLHVCAQVCGQHAMDHHFSPSPVQFCALVPALSGLQWGCRDCRGCWSLGLGRSGWSTWPGNWLQLVISLSFICTEEHLLPALGHHGGRPGWWGGRVGLLWASSAHSWLPAPSWGSEGS